MAEYKKLPDGTIVKVAGQGGIADNLSTLSPVMSLSAKQGNVLDTNKANKTDISSIITTGTKNTTGAQIASGTYFYLNGQLVKAKSNIAVNDDYTLNTNYEIATVGGVLTELNSKVILKNSDGIYHYRNGSVDIIVLHNCTLANFKSYVIPMLESNVGRNNLGYVVMVQWANVTNTITPGLIAIQGGYYKLRIDNDWMAGIDDSDLLHGQIVI